MQKKLFALCALICSALTFFGVGYVFYSGGTPFSAVTAIVPMIGVIVFNRLKA
ncbi:MAG: hypothetical protein J6C75_05700 [Oscillospiraceae bacterium]|nr:hypothetical protein [Oscillospiraceae bacterium]